MLVVFPFHSGDKAQAVTLAGWIREMGEVSDHNALLCIGDGCDESGVIEPLRECFGKVSAFRPEAKAKRGEGMMGYARSANAMWQSVAWKIYFQDKMPWLWLEPDAIPTRPSWLREIWEDHKASKKAFSGTMGQCQIAMLNGVAVYPPNVCDFAPLALQAGDCPWDLNAASQILKFSNVTDLFQHIYQVKGDPPTFPKHADKLSKSAAIFHRCKDGTLISYLKKHGFTKGGETRGQEEEKEERQGRGLRLNPDAAPTVQPAVAADDSEALGEPVDYAERLEQEARRHPTKPVVPNEGDRLGELVWRGGKWHTAEAIVATPKGDRTAVFEKYKHPEKDLSGGAESGVTAPDPIITGPKDGANASPAQTPSRDDLVKDAVAVLKQLCSSPRATSQVRKELKKQKVITK